MDREYRKGIDVAQSSMPGTVSIHVTDDMTHQVMLLTQKEAEALKEALDEIEFEDAWDDVDEAQQHQKALTLYNLHAFPTVDRKAYEAVANLANPNFEFEIIQHIKNANGEIVESKSVGSL